MVQEIKTRDEFDQIMASDKVVFVDFYTDWCGPCRVMSPVFEDLAKNSPDGAEFYKLNIDNFPEIAEEFQVHAIPTFVVLKGRQTLDTVRGANRMALTNLIENGLRRLL